MNAGLTGELIVVTGGAGFIGSHLVPRLARAGASVRVVDNLERGLEKHLQQVRNEIEFRVADLRDGNTARTALRGASAVIHLAAKVGGIKVYTDRPGTVLHDNLLIDQNVIAAALETGVSRFVYASSAHVYPIERQLTPDSPALREADAVPAAPVLTYGWGKRIGEVTLQSLALERDRLAVAIPRIMGAYGPNQDYALETGSVIPVLCHRAAVWPRGAPFRVWGTGRETRSYVYIDDVVEGLVRSLDALATVRVLGPFNLAAPGRVSIGDIARKIIVISGKNIPLEFASTVPTVIWGQAADPSLAAELLGGWQARVTLDEGLRREYDHIAACVLQAKEI